MSLEGRLELENTDFKNTQKLTWLADCDSAQTTPTICFHFDHLITKGVLKPEDDFKDYVNYHSKVTIGTNIFFCIFLTKFVKFWHLVKFSPWFVVGVVLVVGVVRWSMRCWEILVSMESRKVTSSSSRGGASSSVTSLTVHVPFTLVWSLPVSSSTSLTATPNPCPPLAARSAATSDLSHLHTH